MFRPIDQKKFTEMIHCIAAISDSMYQLNMSNRFSYLDARFLLLNYFEYVVKI